MDDDAHRSAVSRGEAEAWTVLARLISGPLMYGVLGWLVDRWLALSLYVTWLRFKALDRQPPSASSDVGHAE